MQSSINRTDAGQPVDAVRAFNRFYTRRLGLLDRDVHDSGFSLPEVRVLYELSTTPERSTSELARALDLDPGYISRLVTRLHDAGLVRKGSSPVDGRQSLLALTAKGARRLKPIEDATRRQIAELLDLLPSDRLRALLRAMRTVRRVLDDDDPMPDAYLLREPRVGDYGWIVHRQAVLYAGEFGWDATFEGMLADIVARFLKDFDPSCERAWIAERDGEIVGAVLLVRQSARVAQLRMLFVEPSARGLGIGGRLVDACIAFARENGYRTLVLWTNDILGSARRIYEAAGFTLTRTEAHRSFGKDLVGQFWSLGLRP